MDFMYGLAIQYISVMATGRFIIDGLFQTKSKQGEGGRGGGELRTWNLKKKHVEIPGVS